MAKSKAVLVLLSSCDDGTGVSRCTGVKYAETHQTPVLNGSADMFHSRPMGIRILVVMLIAALLDAKRFGFETAPLADIVNILMMTAEMVRVLMAKSGFRSVNEPIGHVKVSGEESASRDGSLLFSPKPLSAHHLPRVLVVSRKM